MREGALYDILGAEGPIPLKRGWFLRFRDEQGSWIDVELRDGDVTVRGSTTISIHPSSGNQIVVRLDR